MENERIGSEYPPVIPIPAEMEAAGEAAVKEDQKAQEEEMRESVEKNSGDTEEVN